VAANGEDTTEVLEFIFSFIFYLMGKKGNFNVVTEQTEPRFKSHNLCN
jgi:hypothetical protein